MREKKQNFEKTLEELKKKRASIQPIPKKIEDLKTFEKQLKL